MRGPLLLALGLAVAAFLLSRSAIERLPESPGDAASEGARRDGRIGKAGSSAEEGRRSPGGVPPGSLREDLVRSEAELAALRARGAELKERLQEMAGRSVEASAPPSGAAQAGPALEPKASFRGPEGPEEVADLLGLDSARADLLKAEAGRLLQRMRAMQMERAVEETKDGKLVRHLPALDAELEPLRKEWRRWIEGTLSAVELRRYERFRWDGVFFRYAKIPRRQEIERLPDGERVAEMEDLPPDVIIIR